MTKKPGEQKDEQEADQVTSEEQNYQGSVRIVSLYIGWNQVSEFESSASLQGHNTFAGSRHQSTCKISVELPSDNWIWQK